MTPPAPIDSLDLLIVAVSTNTGNANAELFATRLGSLLDALIHPPCTSVSQPAPHGCDPGDAGDRPIATPVRHMNLAVVDGDLGTPGHTFPGCYVSEGGDQGLLNPIRFGPAERMHEPWIPTGTTPAHRPSDCAVPNIDPSFIQFESGTTDAARFTHDALCNVTIDGLGCGLSQPLEAMWRALIWHDASDHAGNTDPNAGFVRDDAVLAIVVLDDREDLSVVDCRYLRAGDPPCPRTDATNVYDSMSTAWPPEEILMRFYLDHPCSADDPTWPLERYVDPAHPDRGLLGLKPGHPERVVFSAIAGVPLAGDGYPSNADGSTDWDGLIGTPGANGPDDFCGRNANPTGASVDATSAEGSISMRQANQDPNCSVRVTPACRRRGTMDNASMPACSTTEQYFSPPTRRIAEIARRFDQAPLCAGAPCHNGLITSVCENDYADAMAAIAARIQARLR